MANYIIFLIFCCFFFQLWCHFHEPERVEYACRKSLANFGLDYLDLYLMHWPYSYVHRGDDVMMPTNAKGDVELRYVCTSSMSNIWVVEDTKCGFYQTNYEYLLFEFHQNVPNMKVQYFF